jgi:arylsulfatase
MKPDKSSSRGWRTLTPLLLYFLLAALLSVNSFLTLTRLTRFGYLEADTDVSLNSPLLESNKTTIPSRASPQPQPVELNKATAHHDSSSAAASAAANVDKEDKDEPKPKKKLNVIVFYPDDWRHDTIGAAGTQVVKTPFLDKLSSQGIRFTHNAVTSSVCWISRATKITGQYLSRHKAALIRTPTFYDRWNETFPYIMQQNGYFVGHIGKWQFNNPDNFVRKHYNWTSLYEGRHWYKLRKVPTHSTLRDEQESIRFLRQRPKDVPFVLTTAFYAPKAVGRGPDQHSPMNETQRLYENITIPLPVDPEKAFKKLPKFMQELKLEARRRYRQRFDFNVPGKYQEFMTKYYRMVSEVDAAIERIVGELERQNILNETIIIFTTDNGLFHGEHGFAGKWFPYQESIRVPLIIKDPRMSQEKIGTLEDAFTLNVDLASTILGAAGLPPRPLMQGRDITDLYLKPGAKETWRKEFFYEHPAMGYKNKGIPESSALVRKDFKYMNWPNYTVEQLFDLKNDPLEHNDIVNRPEYAELLVEMRVRHDELKKSVL